MGQARPFPAQVRAPSVYISDWLSPTLWSSAVVKCLSCINRAQPCSAGAPGTRCDPCARGSIKCSRYNNAAEDAVLHEKLRPFYALSSDCESR